MKTTQRWIKNNDEGMSDEVGLSGKTTSDFCGSCKVLFSERRNHQGDGPYEKGVDSRVD